MGALTLIPIEDHTASLLCALAALRLTGEQHSAQAHDLAEMLRARGCERPYTAAEQLARMAIDVEREARSK
jgi:hypothetical protein